jgi:plasmid stability protein
MTKGLTSIGVHSYCIHNGCNGGAVATLTIKNLPDELYTRIKSRAAANRRSINGEAIVALESALGRAAVRDPGAVLAMMRHARSLVRRVQLTDAEIRAARTAGCE